MHCIVYRILHVWCISAFRGICNIFKSFWKRCLTHQLLEFSVCLCSFSKIAYYNLGINLFFTLLLQYIFSTYKLNCVVWYTVLIYSIYDMIFFNNFYFTLFIHLRQSTTQQPTAWWHDTVRLDRIPVRQTMTVRPKAKRSSNSSNNISKVQHQSNAPSSSSFIYLVYYSDERRIRETRMNQIESIPRFTVQ